ncbi:MAG: DUF3146 family protein [Thermostichales cyanobacterium DRC_bins_46]
MPSLSVQKPPMPPQTIAHLWITEYCWDKGTLGGTVSANGWQWHFCWNFRQGSLRVEPSLGRGHICEPLSRFLEQCDYTLELGGQYHFLIRSRF